LTLIRGAKNENLLGVPASPPIFSLASSFKEASWPRFALLDVELHLFPPWPLCSRILSQRRWILLFLSYYKGLTHTSLLALIKLSPLSRATTPHTPLISARADASKRCMI